MAIPQKEEFFSISHLISFMQWSSKLCFLSFDEVPRPLGFCCPAVIAEGNHQVALCKMVQFSSVVQSYPILCDPMNRSMPGLPVHHQLPEFTQTHVHWVSDAIQPSHPLSFPSLLLPLIFPSIRIFSNESALHIRWPKYWSFRIRSSNEHPGLLSFRMNWLDLLAVQGTLKSSPIPQFKSINSLALSFLHSPTLTSIHDYWKNHLD